MVKGFDFSSEFQVENIWMVKGQSVCPDAGKRVFVLRLKTGVQCTDLPPELW